MRSSSGNGAGIGVSLHNETILKEMLPKLKSGTYIVVYRSNLGTFWYILVCKCLSEFQFILGSREGYWVG